MMSGGLSRRELLRHLGLGTAAVVALPELSRVLLFQRELLARQGQPAAPPETALSGGELAALAAACARIVPTDDSGPGATEANAAQYINRSLAGWLGPSRSAYAEGLAGLDAAAQKRQAKRFADLSAVDQDAVLSAIEDTPFFALLRTHTIQGTFCDPAYGGNAGFVGWDLIGYPGVRLAVTPDDQKMGVVLKPMRRSAYDYAMFSAMGATHAH